MRWLALGLASLLLHWLVFAWFDGQLALPRQDSTPPPTVQVALLAPPPPVVPAPAKPKPRAKPAPKPRPVAMPATPPAEEAPPLPIEEAPAQNEPSVADRTETDEQADSERVDAAAQSEPSDANEDSQQAGFAADPPPSAELHFDVYALRNGQNWYGNGVFRWESEGGRYRLQGEASVRLIFSISVLNFSSEGLVNGHGIAPVLYVEKPWRKSATNTHFQHAEQKISFSASTATYPYRGGEQDRASIIWQLASIGRATPERFYPGAVIEVVVAGTRDANDWRIEVAGQEEVETALGRMTAWRLVRQRKLGGYDQRIDIWLAPQHYWYPVKVRHTYASGDYLELSLSKLVALAASELPAAHAPN